MFRWWWGCSYFGVYVFWLDVVFSVVDVCVELFCGFGDLY